MYEDTEDAPESASASFIDTKDFFNALALLHSTDNDSTDKLRKMLDASIEKKLGADKTLRARLPKRSYRNTRPRERGSLFNVDKSEKQDDKLRKTDYKLFESCDEENVRVDEANDRGDIPRISIPDEGSGDGIYCKVCNGTKLGPLILLECQDCQDAYHPLCHLPPVVDVDVYDPRIVWHCNNCIDTVYANHDPLSNEKKTKKKFVVRRGDTRGETKESSVNADKLVKTKESLSKHGSSTTSEKTCPDTVRETDVRTSSSNNDQVISYSKDSLLSIRKTKSLSSSQLKKRIGSKLSVARVVTKQS